MAKNIHFQCVYSSTAPANRPPMAPAMGALAPKKPSDRFRALPGGQVTPIMATALGMMRAPPMPDSARMTLKPTKLWVQKPLTRDHSASHAVPRTRQFRCPKTAPRRPARRTNVPWVNLRESVKTWIWKSIGGLTDRRRPPSWLFQVRFRGPGIVLWRGRRR
jgi:hypothetical protein